MQQSQTAYQKEIDELRLRLKRAHLESQQFRELIEQQKMYALETAQQHNEINYR
jgi:hypothetical protein